MPAGLRRPSEGTLFADPHVSALVPITLHRVSE